MTHRECGALSETIEEFFEFVNDDSNSSCSLITPRHRAWEHCHKAFLDMKDTPSPKENSEYLSLHLAVYLANWGMYRNIHLMNNDYKIHKGAIEFCLERQYDLLWNYESKENDLEEAESLLFGPQGIAKKLRDYYRLYKPCSDTLITKILLGIFGCTPAFDKRFRRVFKSLMDNRICSGYKLGFCKESFTNVRQIVMKNRDYLRFNRPI